MSDQVHAGLEHVYSCCDLMIYHQMVYEIVRRTEQGISELIHYTQGLEFLLSCLLLYSTI